MLGQTELVQHRIDVGDSHPIRQSPHREHPAGRKKISVQVQDMLHKGVIRESQSPYAAPVVLVRKKNGSWRFCKDYRRLNAVTKRVVWPLPRIDDALDRLRGARYFSALDLESGYWQVPVADEDQEKTAFITPDGLYEFRRMPFGLSDSPATFQYLMDKVLGHLKWTACLVYLDDCLVYAPDFEEHQRRLRQVLLAISKAGLTMNPKKCSFAMPSTLYLGHQIQASGILPDPAKTKAVAEYPIPTRLRELRAYLGFTGYYRRFIKDYSSIAHPLHELLKKTGQIHLG